MTITPTSELWLVSSDYCEYQEVLGIFTSEELAEKFVEDCENRVEEIKNRGITEEEEQLQRDKQYWRDLQNGKYDQTMFTELEESVMEERIEEILNKIDTLRTARYNLISEKEQDFTFISSFFITKFSKGINNGTI